MLLCPEAGGFGNTTGFDTLGTPQAYFDATSEEAYTFIDQWIGEMAGLFPDKVLHLGGDEDGSTCYTQSASVQKWLAQHPGVVADDLIPLFWTRAQDRCEAWQERHELGGGLRCDLPEGGHGGLPARTLRQRPSHELQGGPRLHGLQPHRRQRERARRLKVLRCAGAAPPSCQRQSSTGRHRAHLDQPRFASVVCIPL